MKNVYLKPQREKSIKNRHPWIFKSAVKPASCAVGEIVQVCLSTGKPAALAFYNPLSQICLRIFSWNPETEITKDFWTGQIRAALSRREFLLGNRSETDSCRLVFGEADRLPGLIVDQFNEYISVQFLTAGMDRLKDTIADILDEELQPIGIIEKSDGDMRKLEGLELSEGVLRGSGMPDGYSIRENGINFSLDLTGGQKTGFYLDQRENRKRTARWAKGLDLLDAFCYSGGFSLNAWKAGARSITSVDSSRPALELLDRNRELNGIPADALHLVEDNAFEFLRKEKQAGHSYDMVILDPPKLAPTISHAKKAMRAYKDLNLQALKIIRKGGVLATFSCSGGISLQDLKMICAWQPVGLSTNRNSQFHVDKIKFQNERNFHQCR